MSADASPGPNCTARPPGVGSFEATQDGGARVTGSLSFDTVIGLLEVGADAIASGHAGTIDLGGVTASDSSGLALLIEWLSIAKSAQQPLRYENIPVQLAQLARLSEVESLLNGSTADA